MSEDPKKLEEELNKFKHAHYKSADFDSLIEKTIQSYNKFKRLKDRKKQDRAVLDLYTLYLQSIEILFINAHALSVKLDRFPSALFIRNDKLRMFVDEEFKNDTKISSWFLNKIIFATKSKNKNHLEEISLYSNILKEVADDYLSSYELLNAYKHGYRIHAKHDKTIMSIRTQTGENIKLSESDSNIVYFSKEKVDGVPIIFEHSLYFNMERISGKCLFICSMLNNMRATILLFYKEKIKSKEVSSFLINDKLSWNKSFGEYRVKKPIFSLVK